MQGIEFKDEAEITKVLIDGQVAGEIRQAGVGWQYIPNVGKKFAGKIFSSRRKVERSLLNDDGDSGNRQPKEFICTSCNGQQRTIETEGYDFRPTGAMFAKA